MSRRHLLVARDQCCESPYGTERLSSRGRATPSAGRVAVRNVRRLFPYVEESIHHGAEWAVFEPNEEPLSELNTN
jgi:hypothetical protein